MVTVDKAWQIIESTVKINTTELVSLSESNNRVLGEDIIADRALPPFDRVTMDGIAIRFDTVNSGTRSFITQSVQKAGEAPHQLRSGAFAIEIMTGAMMPEGADTIIRYEDLIQESEGFAIMAEVIIKSGQNVHKKGSDVPEGGLLVKKGSRINSNVIPVLASCGYAEVPVYSRFRIAVVSTGDELVDVGAALEPWQIRKSNVYAIRSALSSWTDSIELFHIADDQEAVSATIEKLLEKFDVIILSGGVSKGKYDHVPDALIENGVDLLFHGVKQRSGKPFCFGSKDTKVVFALPGNPVSTVACVARYVLPWIKLGTGYTGPVYQELCLGSRYYFDKPLTRLIQSALKPTTEGYLAVFPLYENGSGDYNSLIDADGFMELPADKDEFLPGEKYRFFPI